LSLIATPSRYISPLSLHLAPSRSFALPRSLRSLRSLRSPSPSLLVTPTNDLGKLLSALGKSAIGGISDFSTSLSIAQLALKHRENKNQRQRIVAFVGSPIEDTQDSLVKLGKKLRKNNVLVDIVVFGDEGMENEGKLGALVDAAGGGES
jgi:26S proteasome regulatory subunit N10